MLGPKWPKACERGHTSAGLVLPPVSELSAPAKLALLMALFSRMLPARINRRASLIAAGTRSEPATDGVDASGAYPNVHCY
ncbi:hypothetical protein GCM10027456_76340 [Kineosporia babensis]